MSTFFFIVQEQAEVQPVPNKEDEEGEEPVSEDIAMDVEDDDDLETEDIAEQQPSKFESKKNTKGSKEDKEGELLGEETKTEVMQHFKKILSE